MLSELFLGFKILRLTCIFFIAFMSYIYQQSLPYQFFGFKNIIIDMYLLHSFYVPHITTKLVLSIIFGLKILWLTCITNIDFMSDLSNIAFMSYIYQQNLPYQLFLGFKILRLTCIFFIAFMSYIYQQSLPYQFFGFKNIIIDMYLLHSFYVPHITTKLVLSIIFGLKILWLTCITNIAFMSHINQQNWPY